MARTSKRKPLIVEEAGIAVRIFKRGAKWWGDIRIDGERQRVPLKTTAKSTAQDNARALAKEIATRQLLGVTPDTVTIGQLFEAFRKHRLPALTGAYARSVKTRLELFETAWGADLRIADFSQTHIDDYTARRLAGKLSSLHGRTGRGARAPAPVRLGAVEGELRVLSLVFNFGTRHKVNGKRLLGENPLRDVKRPVERNPLRPVASHDRYIRTLEHAADVDSAGRLRCILALARYTGRRESAICGLRASDLLLSEQRVQAALSAAGLNTATRDADGSLYPHGAIYWSAELDKMKVMHVTPITAEARAELDIYMRKNPRVGDVPLFPAQGPKPKKNAPPQPRPVVPIRRDVAARWLLKAERLAKLPKLAGGVFHPYRRLWATERQHLSDVAVAAAGGWGDTQALKRCYQRARPVDILRAVNGA